MAPYLRSTTSTVRSTQLPTNEIMFPTSFTLPTSSSSSAAAIRVRRRQQYNRMSAEYPSGYHHPSKQQQRLSLMLSHQEKVRRGIFC